MKQPAKLASKGFSLIEMIIVVAMIAILASVALGSYQNSMQKSRRVDAKSTLLDIAAEQEKFYFQNNNYSDNVTTLFGQTTSPEGYYTLVSKTDAADTGCANDGACFLLSATVVTTGTQKNDSSCVRFEVTNTGLQSSFDAATAGNDTSSVCW